MVLGLLFCGNAYAFCGPAGCGWGKAKKFPNHVEYMTNDAGSLCASCYFSGGGNTLEEAHKTAKELCLKSKHVRKKGKSCVFRQIIKKTISQEEAQLKSKEIQERQKKILSLTDEPGNWEVVDIIDKGFKEGNIDHNAFRIEATNICREMKMFTFQFKGSDSVQTVLEKRESRNKHVMRYFCSRSMMTKDPIMGDTYYTSGLNKKKFYFPNTLHWNNFDKNKKEYWDMQDGTGKNKTTSTKNIKKQCLEFGFKEGSEKFADCQLKLYTLTLK